MRLIDADELELYLCSEDYRLRKYCFPCREMFEAIKAQPTVPSVEPELNNHTIACLLAELYDDACACNYNDIDEWLPEKCELLDACPNPVGVACWEQFLKHKAERRTDE